jgi:exosortase/archaeosortase
MNKEQLAGAARELLTAVFGLIAGYGIVNDQQSVTIVGALLALVMLVYSVFHKEGWEIITSAVRKLISTTGGALIGLGYITPEKWSLIAALCPALISVAWSVSGKAGPPVPP